MADHEGIDAPANDGLAQGANAANDRPACTMFDGLGSKKLSRKLNRVVDQLTNMNNDHDVQYALVVCSKDHVVKTFGSLYGREWIQHTRACTTFPSAVMLARMAQDMARLTSANLTFQGLGDSVQQLLMLMINCAIPGRKQLLAFSSKPSLEQVHLHAPWWPEGVVYTHPKELEPTQRVQLANSMVEAALDTESQAHLSHLHQDCCARIHTMRLRIPEMEEALAAINRLFAGELPCMWL